MCALLLIPAAALAASMPQQELAAAGNSQLLEMLSATTELRGRCGTMPAAELAQRGLTLPMAALAPGDTLYYDTPEGHFRIEYTLTGSLAVDSEDKDQSGVPDYVELCGSAMERSWAVEVDSLGFGAPDIGAERYAVSTIFGGGFFGLTQVDATSPGGTSIRVRFSMDIFCTSAADSAICATNALIVTLAHEFKHAIQVSGGWNIYQIGGWIELDATWIEDLVYDDSNDYYRFIDVSGSPFLDPQRSLTQASYEDCTWQHYLGENHGSDFMLDFDHELVAGQPAQPAQLAYLKVAEQRELDWGQLWGDYTVATYLSGERAVDGMGFEEGAFYPQARAVAIASLPLDAVQSSLADMAMHLHEYSVPAEAANETLEIEFAGGGGVEWTLRVVFQREDLTLVLPVELQEQSVIFKPEQNVADFDRVAVLVGNSRVPLGVASGGSYTLKISSTPYVERSSMGGFKGRYRPSGSN
ncbi:hypothetical protein DRQ53_06365 [bacterium]|nr:MAG: hypothetical protein DRQ32_08725 [bacterium]RKZ16441.1 MAG: hypothetical protein DRQ53_06365 [bacterium]